MSQIFTPSSISKADPAKSAVKDESNQRKCDSHGENDDESRETSTTTHSDSVPDSVLSPRLRENSELAADLSTKTTATSSPGAAAIDPAPVAAASITETTKVSSPAHGSKNTFVNNTDTSSTLAQVMKRSHWRINFSIRSKRVDYDRICSICLSESPSYYDDHVDYSPWSWLTRLWRSKPDSCDYNPLISPCLCAGKRSHQHKRCIENWIEQTGASDCPFCFVRYEYLRKRKSFWSYVKECELEREFRVGLTAFAFASYLFLVGLSVCHHYILEDNNNNNIDSSADDDDLGSDARNVVELTGRKATEGAAKTASNCGQQSSSANYRDAARKILADLEGVLACHLSSYWRGNYFRNQPPTSAQELMSATSNGDALRVGWLSLLVFCFVSTVTVLLLMGIISMGFNMAFRHYVRYWLWSRTHFRVEVKPYTFEGAPSEPIGDGLRAVEQSTMGSNHHHPGPSSPSQ